MQVGVGAGRPVSHVTTAFLTHVCDSLKADGKKVLRLVWDTASWHRIHAKRAVVEPGRLLSKAELIRHSYADLNGQYVQPLQQVIAKKAA